MALVAAFAKTKASVASLVVLSASAWVVADVPFGKAGVPDKLAAVPEVLAALFGMSPLTKAGNCACGRVPVVRSDAEITTFELKACVLTVVEVGVYPAMEGL